MRSLQSIKENGDKGRSSDKFEKEGRGAWEGQIRRREGRKINGRELKHGGMRERRRRRRSRMKTQGALKTGQRE